MPLYYEELRHTADWAIRVWGEDLDALFGHAAEAMFELQGADLAAEPAIWNEVTCRGIDRETLLVAWLNELLFLSEMNDVLYTRFHVRIAPGSSQSLRTPAAAPWGPTEPDFDYALHASIAGLPGRGPLAHVKAATFYDLSVTQSDAGCEATVTFDT
jgi:SHS2 domain-containing protein